MLLDRGADINAKTNSGDTPLHTAAKQRVEEKLLFRSQRDKDLATIRFLLDQGADVTARNSEGKTACQLAEQNEYLKDAEIPSRLCLSETADAGMSSSDFWEDASVTDVRTRLNRVRTFMQEMTMAGHPCIGLQC